jgi:MFS transporter, DHA1 family, multidrug resistance protein
LFEGLPIEVKGLSFVSFFVAVGFGIQAPAIPLIANELGAGNTAVGAMISVFALMRLFVSVPIGRLATKFGERRMMLWGIAMLAVTSVFAGLAQAVWQLILFRGLSGIGSAMYTVAAMSVLLRVASPETRGRAVGLFMGGFNVGLVAGPALGGALSLVLVPRALFFVYGAIMVLSGFVAWRILAREGGERGVKGQSKINPIGVIEAFRSSVFRAAVMANFSLGWISYGMRASLMPLFLLNVLDEGPEWIGISLALGSLVQVVVLPASGKFTDTVGRKFPLLVGEGLLIASLAILLLWPGLLSYLVCLGGLGVATALCTTASSAAVGDVTRGQGGTVIAVYQMGSDLGMVAGPLIAGAIADSMSFSAGISASGAIGVIALIFVMKMPRHAK